jgi:hypothetical protein
MRQDRRVGNTIWLYWEGELAPYLRLYGEMLMSSIGCVGV